MYRMEETIQDFTSCIFVDHLKFEKDNLYGIILNGIEEGFWRGYRRYKKEIHECHYHNGVKEGYSITYRPNGRKIYEGSYKNGEQEGLWIFYYYINGAKSSEVQLKNGLLEGLWKYYSSDGKTIQTKNFKDGKEIQNEV